MAEICREGREMSVGGRAWASVASRGGRERKLFSESFDPRFTIADAKNRIEAIVIWIRRRRWKLLQRGGALVHCRGDNNYSNERLVRRRLAQEKERTTL